MLGILSSQFRKPNAPENQPRILERGSAPPVEFEQQAERVGLLCTEELEIVTARCRKKVEAIARDCRARNARFRDIEFDLEEDSQRCLRGLVTDDDDDGSAGPSDVLRVTQIFHKPRFFIDGANSSDVAQGCAGDCWFLAAVSVVSSMDGMIERICVARDEEVGVYGFIFYRDSGWVDVIIDDLLFVKIPKFEDLWSGTELYHDDREKYDRLARKGTKTLYFGRSKTENETWVPLLEKAYAKLHGDYTAIYGGFTSEGIEDLTGGVATDFHIRDIMDTDKFWNEQLLLVNKDRLFGCALDGYSWTRGLVAGHAYSILDAVEVNGKRFLRIRNPWGRSEWNGPWSDGSKEWTPEWLALLPQLKHKFGDDGEFLMEYKDFLKTWGVVERTKLFDQGWKLSSMWLNVTARSFPCAWNFGDASFTLSISEDTPAVIVLSQLDTRYFSDLSGIYVWSVDFIVYRKGAPADEPYTRSVHNQLWRRSVNVELDNLEAGDYVVHVRLDRQKAREKTYYKDSVDKWNQRKLSKVWAEACLAKSIAVNFNPDAYGDFVPASIETFGGEDLTALELSHYEKSQTKLPEVAAPLAEAAVSADAPEVKVPKSGDESENKDGKGPEEATSESGSTVVIDKEGKETDKGDAPPSVLASESRKLGAASGLDSENKKEKKDDDSKIVKDEDKSDDKDKDKDKKDGDKADKDDKDGKDDKGESKDGIKEKSESKGPDEVVHEGFSCNECQVSPIVGPRYHCLSPACLDYDICSKCMDANKHNPTHQMLCIRNPADGDKLKDEIEEREDNSITLGLKVYTKGNALATVAGQLRHGKVVGWKKKAAAAA